MLQGERGSFVLCFRPDSSYIAAEYLVWVCGVECPFFLADRLPSRPCVTPDAARSGLTIYTVSLPIPVPSTYLGDTRKSVASASNAWNIAHLEYDSHTTISCWIRRLSLRSPSAPRGQVAYWLAFSTERNPSQASHLYAYLGTAKDSQNVV